MNSIENTTAIPQMIHRKKHRLGFTAAQPAVTLTSPANTPFRVIEISGFLYIIIHVKKHSCYSSEAAAKLVIKCSPQLALSP
jgi:hypothetical protein